MRTSNFSRDHPYAKARGWVKGQRAASSLPLVTDGVNEVDNASEILVVGGTVSEPEDGVAQISFGGLSQSSNSGGPSGAGTSGIYPGSAGTPVYLRNHASVDLIPGDVVVTDPTDDSAVTTTATASNTRIAGVVQQPIARLQYGPVLFNGLTTVINTTGTITRGEYALTSGTARLAGSTAARVAGSFGVYLTGTDMPDFASASVTTTDDSGVTAIECDMPPAIPAGRVLFLALWLGSGTSAVSVEGWTQIGSESGYWYFYKISEGDDTAEPTWTGASAVVATVLLCHPNVSLSVPIESHDYDSTTSAAAVSGLSDVARYAIAGVKADVASPGSGFVRLGGGTAGVSGAPELVQASTTLSAGTGGSYDVVFPSPVQAGHLLVVMAQRRDDSGTAPVAETSGWTTLGTIGGNSGGTTSLATIFSKIATGSANDGGDNGTVGRFGTCGAIIAAEFSGISSATPSDDNVDSGNNLAGSGTVQIKRSVTVGTDGLAVMVVSGRDFGGNGIAVGGSSTLIAHNQDNDWPHSMVFRTGTGSLENQIDFTDGTSYAAAAFAFDGLSSSAAGTLAGKYIGHASSATSPFTGGAQQNDGVFAINLLGDAKPSALLYGPDLGAGSGSEPTADAHIADTSDAHDASAISALDSAGYFAGTDVEAVLAELGGAVRGYENHGSAGATETITFATGHHRVTLNANLTVTFTGAVSGDSYWMVVDYVGDGTARTVGYSGSTVTWVGDALSHAGTLNNVVTVIYRTTDGGANVVAQVTGGDTVVAALDDLTDVTLTSPVEDDTLRYVGGVWINDNRRWEAVTDGEDVFVWEGDDLVHEWNGAY